MQILINKVLGLNKLDYINMVDGQFNAWCTGLSKSFYIPMRELQKNTVLHNWFINQWNTRIVHVFLKNNNDYISAGIEGPVYLDLFIQLLNEPNSLLKTYPSAIVKKIKQQHYKSLQNKTIH